MKKIMSMIPAMLLLAAFAAGTSLSGCRSLTRNENNSSTIPEVASHFQKCGLRIDGAKPAMYEMILASDGVAITIDGADVQLFKYDTANKQQKEKLDRIYDKGIITILGVDFNAMTNGSFIMLNYKGHPDELKLIEAFGSFK